MSDSCAIDAALIGALLADGALMAKMPDGVFIDMASPGAERFVIISLLEAHDVDVFSGRAIEDALYLVKAVALSSTGADVRGASARIDALLAEGALTAAGYARVVTFRVERVRIIEVDEVDDSIRWDHRGGHYRVLGSL